MTREDEILKEAKLCASANTQIIGDWGEHYLGFIHGAEWADSHPHWISVDDELPNNYEPVIAAFGRHFARVCFHCGDTWYLDNPPVTEPMSGITHWCPLPQPPHHFADVSQKVKKGGEE